MIKLKKATIYNVIFTIALGILLHFTYAWSNNNNFVGLFSAVNESVWEHLKILFVPMLLTTIFNCFYFKKIIPNYLCTKTKGIFIALIFIIIAHYTYSGIIGNHFAIIDIIIFILAAILGEFYTYKKIKTSSLCNNKLALISLFVVSFLFILFTFKTPHIGIFKDPKTNTYGINQ